MQEPGKTQKRIDVPYFEGVNSLVSFNVGKKTELTHAENARSKTVGTIEKREGQVVLGTNSDGKPFVTTDNYSLFSSRDGAGQGLYRISVPENATLEINVADVIGISDVVKGEVDGTSNNELLPLSIFVADEVGISEKVNDTTGKLATIYYINSSNQWIPLTDSGASIPGGIFDHTYAEGNVFLVNYNSPNRYITSDGLTVVTAASGSGHLFNTPPASRINFYKNRLYLADFVQFGVRYKTTILRSSYPMGIIALINSDYTTLASGSTVDVTDTKYFSASTGANTYDIYRGSTFIKTITVTLVNETSVVATWTGTLTVLASDEIWISGTYEGPKVFRWVSNPTITGKDVKQYDTFKLSGGENDAITMLTNIGNIQLISNKNVMSSWNDYTLENFDLDIGCVSKKGYVKMIGTLYFLHYTGIYATSGGIPKLISNKIEKYITGATKEGKESSAAGKKGRSIFFTLGDVTLYHLDGSVNKILRDVCVEYNLIQENWFIHTNVKAREFATFVESTDSDRLEFTDTAGNHAVKEFLSGETDDGEAIHFRIDTMKFTPQGVNFENHNNLVSLMVETERGSAIRVFVNLENNEEFYPTEGTVVKGLSVIKFTDKDTARGRPPVCRLFSLSLRDSSKQICKLSRMSVIYLPSTNENSDDE